jgi:hypothetical protein
MGLFKPAWEKHNEGKALKAVRKLTDQALLANLARNGKWQSVCIAAINNLTDSAILADIAINTPYNELHRYAHVSQHDVVAIIGEAAVKGITSQSDLADVAKHAHNSAVRYSAVEKLTDQALLTDIAETINEKRFIRVAAAEKSSLSFLAQELYADIAINETRIDSRIEAVEKLTVQTLLAKVAKTTRDHSFGYGVEQFDYTKVREAAVRKLTDQALLAEVAKDAGGYSDSEGTHCAFPYAQAAVKKLTDQALLADLAENAKDAEIRLTALEELGPGTGQVSHFD